MNDLTARAMAFAIEKHGEQLRRYTSTPYWTHLAEVAGMVATAVGADDKMIAAAWLHDCVEDTSASIADIEYSFGRDIAGLVAGLTDISIPDIGNRAARKKLDREHVARGCWKIHTIKLADIISNSLTIAQYDEGFAQVYIPEKKAMLELLVRGDAGLKQRATSVLAAAEKLLGTKQM